MLRSILGNTFFSFVSDVTTRLASALLLILVARKLGESAAGTLALSTNYTLILSAIAFWGLDQLLIRSVGRDRNSASQYFTQFLVIRVFLAPLLWALLAALIFGLQPYQAQTNRVIVLVGGTLVGASVSNLVQSLLLSTDRTWVSALTSVGVSGLLIAATIAGISVGLGIEALALLLLVSSWIQAGALVWVSRRDLFLRDFGFQRDFCWRQFRAGFPFVPIGLFIALEAQLGGILLSFFHSEAAVGLYAMANTVISALALLSQALRLGLFPAMARLYGTESERFLRLYERTWRYLSMISFPLVVLLALFSEWIIYLIYRRPAPEAVLALQLLAPTLLFYFLNIPNARLLILDGRQHVLARLFALSTAVNLVVGLLLIPQYSAAAVAISRVLSMGALFSLGWLYVGRHILAASPWKFIWKPAVSTGTMALLIFVALPGSPLLVRALVGIGAYLTLLILLKAIPADDWSWLRATLESWAPRLASRR